MQKRGESKPSGVKKPSAPPTRPAFVDTRTAAAQTVKADIAAKPAPAAPGAAQTPKQAARPAHKPSEKPGDKPGSHKPFAKRLQERVSGPRVATPAAGPTLADFMPAAWSRALMLRYGLVPSMQVAFIASLTFHLFVILAVGFKAPNASNFAAPHNQLEVVLVNSKTDRAPEKADALAQANLDGGGNTEQALRASTPLPNVESRQADKELSDATQRLQKLEQEAARLMSSINAKKQLVQGDVAETPAAKAAPAEAAELAEKSIEIARLEAQIKLQFQQYQERPKRQFIGARTKEYRFAQYVDGWRGKVERVGNLNYPEEAKKRQIYGNLQLTVAIKANGDVESIEINRSSGHRMLDEAARRIVMLSAPFEPFPPAIRRDTDILHITRTWQFTRSDLVMEELR
jgi:periplasmic protein TonB